jgi:hypothetical protein
MDARPLTPAEQFAFTSGLCRAFAEAAQSIVGGTPTVLISTDARVAARHDHPEDVPLDLHVFLTQADGTVVDAEGRRSLNELLTGFGIHQGYAYTVTLDPEWTLSHECFGHDTPEHPWCLAISERLNELGWIPEQVPPARGVLNKGSRFRQAMSAWNTDWSKQYTDRLEKYRQAAAVLEVFPSTVKRRPSP